MNLTPEKHSLTLTSDGLTSLNSLAAWKSLSSLACASRKSTVLPTAAPTSDAASTSVATRSAAWQQKNTTAMPSTSERNLQQPNTAIFLALEKCSSFNFAIAVHISLSVCRFRACTKRTTGITGAPLWWRGRKFGPGGNESAPFCFFSIAPLFFGPRSRSDDAREIPRDSAHSSPPANSSVLRIWK